MGGIESKIAKHAGLIAFVYQLTEKDIAARIRVGKWKTDSIQNKVMVVGQIIAGRTVGINPFPIDAGYNPTFNLGNFVNRTSVFGAGLYALSEVGLIASKWSKVGQDVLVWGGIGGVFDAPAPEVSGSPDRPYAPAVNTITAGALNGTGRGY